MIVVSVDRWFIQRGTLICEIFATNNICDFCELTPLMNFFVANIPAHTPKYRYRQCMVRLTEFLVANFSAHAPDLEPICKIYCLRIFPNSGYVYQYH